MQEEDEHRDITAMVSRIDSLKQMMHVMVDQMQEFTAVHPMDKGKHVMEPFLEDVPMWELREPKTIAQVPFQGRARWQLKDLKFPKYNGNTAARSADAVEQWLSKWEQCFCLCGITDDLAKIQEATYNLLDVAHRWWRKIEKDHREPATWTDFKAIFYNNFVPPNERSRALNSWFYRSTTQCRTMQTDIGRFCSKYLSIYQTFCKCTRLCSI